MATEHFDTKLAAIFYADVAGYSRLTGKDEEGTHRVLSAYLDLMSAEIENRNGRVVHYAGDAVLAEFASVVDALSCSVECQRALSVRNADRLDDDKIQFRIGINLGEVIVDRDDIYGNGVNIAARLESLSETGGICISQAIRDAVGTKLPLIYEDMGEQAVKNIADPVHAYHVQVPADAVMPEAGSKARHDAANSLGGRGGISVAALRPFLAIAVLLLLAVGIAVYRWQPWVVEDAELDTRRIAVLPFDNLSPDIKDAYFADGVTEEMISQLSRIDELRVIARTSVLKYQDTTKGVDVIGQELDVGTILEGSVRKAGDKVRITVQLIDARSQTHLWSKDYDRTLGDIFAVQADIARQVADALRITLLPVTAAAVKTPGTNNPEAYDAYLRGLYFWNQRTAGALRKATHYFEKAIALDPHFATAYAMLSDNYYQAAMEEANDMSPDEVTALARQTAEKAIELDPNLAEGYVALAGVMLDGDWDWHGAEAGLRKAIALNPSYAFARKLLGHQLLSVVLRQHEEGISQMQMAVELDPWSPSYQSGLGWAYYHAERFDEALAQFRKSREMFPEHVWSGIGVAQSLMMRGRRDEAVSTMEKTAALRPEHALYQGLLAWAYGAAGLADKARAVLDEIHGKDPDNPPAMALAWGYTGLGDKEKALTWLEKAFDNHDWGILYMQALEFRQVLAVEPRYQQLRKKMKLEGPEN